MTTWLVACTSQTIQTASYQPCDFVQPYTLIQGPSTAAFNYTGLGGIGSACAPIFSFILSSSFLFKPLPKVCASVLTSPQDHIAGLRYHRHYVRGMFSHWRGARHVRNIHRYRPRPRWWSSNSYLEWLCGSCAVQQRLCGPRYYYAPDLYPVRCPRNLYDGNH